MMDGSLIGCSEVHKQLLEKLIKFASTDAEVLISGPNGIGKELYAKFIHQQSPRAKFPFVPINCGMLDNGLMENELFGHVGGAFTGARPNSEGLVKAAEKGTLFLDEVDSLPLPSQVKLLRFIQEKEYRRLGETNLSKANIRIIAATNIDLRDAVNNGTFREDLFFRLRVIPIEVPPLCERPDDVSLLMDHFVSFYAKLYCLPKVCFSDAAFQRLGDYPWPGNVRELQNCVCFLTCLKLSSPVEPEDLPLLGEMLDEDGPTLTTQANTEQPLNDAKRKLVTQFERNYLQQALRQTDGNISRAARASGKPRRAFFELMRKHGIKAEKFRCKPESIDPTTLEMEESKTLIRN